MAEQKRYDVFTVRDAAREGDKPFWTKIGMAILNRDGESFSVFLDALPLNGKLQIRLPLPKKEDGAPRRDF